MNASKKLAVFSIMGLTALVLSCQTSQPKPAEEMSSAQAISRAVCMLYPTVGNDVKGMVTFEQTDSGMHVVAELTGLTEGKHGFHIHEYGDISAADGTSTGGHFNPDNQPHGAPTDAIRHVGDLGNITAMADGTARLEMTDTTLAFQGPHSIIGRGVVVHAGEDDLTTQPTGNAGARVACGVIGIAE